jgi:hypothetical protein
LVTGFRLEDMVLFDKIAKHSTNGPYISSEDLIEYIVQDIRASVAHGLVLSLRDSGIKQVLLSESEVVEGASLLHRVNKNTFRGD